jgi:hypothetical protein
VSCELDDLGAVVGRLVKVDWTDFSSSALDAAVVDLQRVRNRLDAVDAAVLSAFDRSRVWAEHGNRSAASRLTVTGRLPRKVARSRTRLGRQLRTMPRTTEALADGAITSDHARVLGRANRPEVRELFARDERLLVDLATDRDLSFRQFEHAVQYWADIADPDSAEDRADTQIDRREVHASTTLDGRVRLDGWLDPLSGAEFRTELERIEQETFDADWAEARDRLGDAATADDLARTAPQRRADALVAMARRANAHDGPAARAKFVVNLHLDWATAWAELARYDGTPPARAPYPTERVSELDDGTPLPPSLVLDAALAGEVRRVVFGDDGHILDFGRTKRFFTGALRDALAVRDRTCAEPGCEVPARQCQADHDVEWADGGATSERHGRMYCGWHNRWKAAVNQRRRRRGPP